MIDASKYSSQRVSAFGLILFLALVIAAGGLIGLSDRQTANYRWMIVAAPIGVFVLLLVYGAILKHWEWGIYALIAYMPFSGLPGILLNSIMGTGLPSLIKDFLFMIPAYFGFAWWYRNNPEKTHLLFPGAKTTLTLMGLLAGLVIIQMFNPQLVNFFVGLIGLKVWLFYLPLYFLGYHFIRSKAQLIRVSQMLLAMGMVAVLFGIIQAQLIYTGDTDLAYAIYGSAAANVTQFFANFQEAGGVGLKRVPGLFTFPLQYSCLLFTLLAVAYALWNGGDSERTHTNWYALALIAVSVAFITSGIRAAYVLLPGFLLLAVLLDGRLNRIWKQVLTILALVFAAVGTLVWLLGSTMGDFLSFAYSIIVHYLGTGEGGLINQFDLAMRLTWFGMGTGMNTNQARYALGSDALSSYINIAFNAGVESFQGKVILELGVPGLIVAVGLFGWLLFSAYRRLRELHDDSLRAFGIGLLALLIMTVAYLYNSNVLDYDPLNVYFWLFAGILMKLPELQADSRAKCLPLG